MAAACDWVDFFDADIDVDADADAQAPHSPVLLIDIEDDLCREEICGRVLCRPPRPPLG